MVMVQPPEDWVPSDGSNAAASATMSSASISSAAASASTTAPATNAFEPTTAAEAATLRDRWADAAAVAPPPSSDPAIPSDADVSLRGEDWLTPRQRWMRRYGVKVGVPVAGVVATIALWFAFSPGDAPVEETQTTAPAEPSDLPPAAPEIESPDHDPAPVDPPIAAQDPVLVAASSVAPRATEPDEGTTAHPPIPPRDPPRIDPLPVAVDANGDPIADTTPDKPQREPLPVIDVPARLNDSIAKLDYVKTPLVDFLNVMSAYSAVSITLDVDALVEAGIRVDAPVTVRGTKKTVGQALDTALAPLKLRYHVVDQHVFVTTADPVTASPPVRREVTDLVASDAQAGERLAMLVKRFVEPTSWQTQRTTTSIRVDGSALVIVQTPRVVRKIDTFLAALRAARRDPVGAAVAPPPALETRHAQAREALAKKITLNYTTPTPISKIVARLAESSKLRIVVDWQALAAENIGPATTARMVANDVTVENAFASLTAPLGLAVRVLDARTVEITSQDELAGNPELAAFPLADLAADAKMLPSIAEKLTAQFGPPASLAGDGAENFDTGIAWYLDEPSKTLFICAPQDSIVQLAGVFREAREKQKR
jgi:hypothetical protein